MKKYEYKTHIERSLGLGETFEKVLNNYGAIGYDFKQIIALPNPDYVMFIFMKEIEE